MHSVTYLRWAIRHLRPAPAQPSHVHLPTIIVVVVTIIIVVVAVIVVIICSHAVRVTGQSGKTQHAPTPAPLHGSSRLPCNQPTPKGANPYCQSDRDRCCTYTVKNHNDVK